MSHTASIKAVKIQSVSALRAAIAELNSSGMSLSLIENAKPRAFYQDQEGMGQADLVINTGSNCRYDIGLYKQADGSYEARTDFWGQDIEKLFGVQASTPEKREQAKMGKLFQMYGIHAAIEAARRKGQTVRRIPKQDGTISLEITGAGI